MFVKSEAMGDFGFAVPYFSRPVEGEAGLMELVDPTQQMPLWLYNFLSVEVKAQIWVDDVEKQTLTLGPYQDEPKALGSSESFYQAHGLILTCLPEFQNLASQPVVAWFPRDATIAVKVEFSTGIKTVPLVGRFRFASEADAADWTTVM